MAAVTVINAAAIASVRLMELSILLPLQLSMLMQLQFLMMLQLSIMLQLQLLMILQLSLSADQG